MGNCGFTIAPCRERDRDTVTIRFADGFLRAVTAPPGRRSSPLPRLPVRRRAWDVLTLYEV